MKKVLILLLTFIYLCLPLIAGTYSEAHGQYLMGYVNSSTQFTVELFEDVLPFNLEENLVKKNNNPNSVLGLRVGVYTLIVNTNNYSLTVTHDKLVKDGTVNQGSTNSVDYRLDLFYTDLLDVERFKTCFCDDSFVLTQDDGISMTNKSFYVSMDATEAEIDLLEGGNYSSTISFNFEVGV